jgi:hypothetical protein
MNKELNFYLKWTATAILIVGTAVNGLGYYPAGPLMLVLGGILWLIVAIRVKDAPLIVTNLVMSAVGLAAIVYTLYIVEPVVTAPLEGSVKADQYERDMKPDCVDPKERTE